MIDCSGGQITVAGQVIHDDKSDRGLGTLTVANNQAPALTSTTAYWQWSTNPSWTTATISTIGAMVYNTTRRGPTANPSCAIYDFGGTQTVTAGTLTLLQPANDSAHALLRIA